MAGPEDFFSQGPWQDPRVQAGLLQGGLQLMTGPRTWGGGPMAGVADAIGSGGEAMGRQENALRLQQEADSKDQLRASQADAAASRAGTAGANLETQRTRLALMGQELENKQSRNVLGNRVRLANLYQQYRKGELAHNDAVDKNVLMPTAEKATAKRPVLEMDQWIQQNPSLRSLGLLEDSGAGGTSTSSDSLGSTEAPRDPTKRSVGATYQTPRGPLKWNGTSWDEP